MPQIILVQKNGDLKEKSIKDFNENDMYKKCGFRKDTDFGKIHTFKMKKGLFISIFAKISGRSNNINKYELPPPIDNDLLYGTFAIICSTKHDVTSDCIVDISLEQWEKCYERLFGGFEDLSKSAKDDAEEEDELEMYEKDKLTKNGYLKDGFVVEDDDGVDADDEDDSELEDSIQNEETTSDDEDEIEYDEDECDNEDECNSHQGDEEEDYEGNTTQYNDEEYESDSSVGSELAETDYTDEDDEFVTAESGSEDESDDDDKEE